MKYGKGSITKKLFSSTFVFVALLLAFIFLVRTDRGINQKKISTSAKLAEAQQAYEKLSENKERLAKKADYLKTEQGIQSEIRSKFRMAEEGESVAVIIGDENLPTAASSTASKVSWWQKVLVFIGI